MEDLIIYEDDEQTVVISSILRDFLEYYYVRKFRLEKPQFNALLALVLKDAESNGIKLQDVKILANGTVPIVKYGQGLVLIDKFQCFDLAFDILTSIEDYDKIDKDEIKDLIEENSDIHFLFFPKEVFKVRGYMYTLNDNNELIVSFFSYN
nr:MAG: hypothetical protein [Bacteriophage sp.]